MSNRKDRKRLPPQVVTLSCGCTWRTSFRRSAGDESWCYVHRTTAVITDVREPVPRKKAGEGMTPLF